MFYVGCFLSPTGNSSECPSPENAADQTVCLDNGECLDGVCIPFCEAVLDLHSCACNGTQLKWPFNGNMVTVMTSPKVLFIREMLPKYYT